MLHVIDMAGFLKKIYLFEEGEGQKEREPSSRLPAECGG